MLCPDCGAEVSKNAESCPQCGRLQKSPGSKSEGTLVKILLIILAIVFVLGTGYFVFSHYNKEPAFNPSTAWAPMDFTEYGLKMDVPGTGWSLSYDDRSQVIFRDEGLGKLDIVFLGARALNPDAYRVDKNTDSYNLHSQSVVFLKGFGGALYTVVSGQEDGTPISKHQLYFKRTFTPTDRPSQTIIYIITLDYASSFESQYSSIFRHLLESIELYE